MFSLKQTGFKVNARLGLLQVNIFGTLVGVPYEAGSFPSDAGIPGGKSSGSGSLLPMENKVFRGAVAFGSAFLLAVPAIAPIHQAEAAPLPSVPLAEFGHAEFGVATWYGEKFHGLETASGEMFDMFRLTAAHRRIPLGSMVRVTNLKNGRSVVVRINDRGPVIESVMLDLSFAAAQKLGIVEQGRAEVRLDQLVEIALNSPHSPSRN
jgi:hypothetical protein